VRHVCDIPGGVRGESEAKDFFEYSTSRGKRTMVPQLVLRSLF
jgi:hypothetical protein